MNTYTYHKHPSSSSNSNDPKRDLQDLLCICTYKHPLARVPVTLSTEHCIARHVHLLLPIFCPILHSPFPPPLPPPPSLPLSSLPFPPPLYFLSFFLSAPLSICSPFYLLPFLSQWSVTAGRAQQTALRSALVVTKASCEGCQRPWMTLSLCSPTTTLGSGRSKSPAWQRSRCEDSQSGQFCGHG